MTTFQCWFCGQSVETTDAGAVMITVQNLWRWNADPQDAEVPCQAIYAHSACAKDRMRGATMALEPDTFLEGD